MNIVKKSKESVIAREIESLETKLKTIDPHTQGAEYKQLLEIRGLLVEQADTGWFEKIDPNLVVKVVSTLGIVGAIMLFEAYGHVFVSKATAFLPKIL